MYSFAIYLYGLGVLIASLFGNRKARLMVRGHWKTFSILKRMIEKDRQYIWFHAASLGEFEQGRPLMERLRREHPEYKILLTFFSPSGYEVRKNYEGADVICYLPFDTPINVHRFLRLAHPVMAFFIKYEFWQNYLKGCNRRDIPVYSVSSIFRPTQIFFRWYGGRYYKVLNRIKWYFVQNEQSRSLLASRGVTNVTVVGDTRFDRVIDISRAAKDLPIVKAFCQDKAVFVAGSSWPQDEAVYLDFFKRHTEWKVIIAPHEIHESRLSALETALGGDSLRYTHATEASAADARVLIIDCYGLLSSIYRYGCVAYVGGGFGVGIHNVPEAAVYGVPVVIGPNNQRFQEAQHLLQAGGCFEVHSGEEFAALMERFQKDETFLKHAGSQAGTYIAHNAGASDAIFSASPFAVDNATGK
jgi:3-deoxy-D-manno-octulosonic-acid transferase